MRLGLLLVLAACSPAASSAPASPQALSIAVRPPRVGRTTHERMHSLQKLTFSDAGDLPRAPIVIDEASAYDDTVDAVTGLAVTRVTAQVSRTLSDKSAPPRTSKWQVTATAEDGHVVFRDSSGAPLGEDGVRDVHDHYRALGQPEPFLAHAPALPLRVGARVPELEDAVRDRLRRDDPEALGRVLEAHVTVREVSPRTQEALLAWKAHLTGHEHGYAFDGTVDGTMRIRSDGLLTHIAFTGHGRGKAASGAAIPLEQSEVHDYTYEEPR